LKIILKFGQQKIWGKNGNNFEIKETFENLEKFQKFGMFWKFRTKFGNLEKKLEIWKKGRNLGGKLEICRKFGNLEKNGNLDKKL